MIIEESIFIHATMERVWKTFTDLTCWKDWNKVLKNVSPEKTMVLSEGGEVKFCIYPFKFPVYFEPEIEEVIPHKRVVWTSGRYGVSARHEFFFKQVEQGVLVISRESFKGISVKTLKFLFPKSRLRDLTVVFLKDMKRGAEKQG
jgi:hypothetical protein